MTLVPSLCPAGAAVRPGLALLALAAWLAAAAPAAEPRPATDRDHNLCRYGAWRSSRIGGGGYLQQLWFAPSNPAVQYVNVDVGGIYRSADDGQTWTAIHGTADLPPYHVRSILPDPRDPDWLLAASGTSWEEMDGLRLTTDAGKTWTKPLAASFLTSGRRAHGFILARAPDRVDTLLAAADNDGLYISRDNAKTWARIDAPELAGLGMSMLHFDARNPRRVWLGASGGAETQHWKRVDIQGGLFRSDDGGETWTRLLGPDAHVVEMVNDPVRPERLIGIFDGGLAVRASDDGGETWRPFADGLVAWKEGDPKGACLPGRYMALAAGPDFVLTASTEHARFYRLPGGAEKWEALPEATVLQGDWYSARKPGRFDRYGRAVGFIAVDPRDADRWFFTDWYTLYETRDAGKTWTLAGDGIEVTVTHALRQDPADPGLVYLGMADNGVLISENGGDRFRLSDKFTSDCKAIDFSPLERDRLYAIGPDTYGHRSNQLYVSPDRGQFWHRASMTGLPPAGARFFSSLAVAPDNPRRVYLGLKGDNAAGAGGVHRSDDGGATWTWDGAGMPKGGAPFWGAMWISGRELAAGPGDRLVAISQSGRAVHWRAGVGQPFRAAAKKPGGKPFDLAADPATPGRFYIAAKEKDGGLYRSDDGGDTWTRIYADSGALYVAVDLADPARLAVARDDHRGIMLSRDAGQTWELLDPALPHRRGNQLAFAGDRLLAGSNGNGVFWIPVGPGGEKPVAAQPLPAPIPTTVKEGVWGVFGAEGPQPPPEPLAVPNAQMTDGDAAPTGWRVVWTGEGKAALTRDTETFSSAPASLCFGSDGGAAKASAGLTIPRPDTAAVQVECRMRTAARAKGFTVNLGVQCLGEGGKQLGWRQVAYMAETGDWRAHDRVAPVIAGTRELRLVLAVAGDGTAWLDDLVVRPSGGKRE